MQFNKNILKKYLVEAPIPLAIERTWECEIYKALEFRRPILDVGCGDGIFARILFKEQIDVGIDPLTFELQHAKEQGAYESLIQAWGDSMPFANNSFNTVLSNSVLEHIQGLEPVLLEVYRVLKSDGIFYVTLPTDLFDHYSMVYQILNFLGLKKLQESYRLFFNRFWKHYHFYTPGDWLKLFDKCGFKKVLVQEYGSKEQCLFNDFMVPLTLPNFLVKKIFNRFFLFKTVRKHYVAFLSLILKNRVLIPNDLRNGGLVFIALKKK